VIWLLDTNTIIPALNGASRVQERLNALPDSDRVVTSTIVVAELIYGQSAPSDEMRIGRTCAQGCSRSRSYR
jgi:predicted nucleic acid-binding protein